MRKHISDCISICEMAGLHVLHPENRGKHMAIVCAEGRVFMPTTPSDRRWRYNAASVARKLVVN